MLLEPREGVVTVGEIDHLLQLGHERALSDVDRHVGEVLVDPGLQQVLAVGLEAARFGVLRRADVERVDEVALDSGLEPLGEELLPEQRVNWSGHPIASANQHPIRVGAT